MSTTPKLDSGTPPKKDDLDQLMAEVKRLVEALHTVIPSISQASLQHEPEPRRFKLADRKALDLFTPQTETMQKALFEALLALFLRKEEESSSDAELIDTTNSHESWLPSFADQLTLLLSKEIPTKKGQAGTKELNRSTLCTPEIKDRLEKHIVLTNLCFGDSTLRTPVEGKSKYWYWTSPPSGSFYICNIINGDENLHWSKQNPHYSGDEERRTEEDNIHCGGPSDFGALCLLQVPIRNSILEFRWIGYILAQTGFLNYKTPGSQRSPEFDAIHLASFMCFLGTFSGHWPSAVERASFSFRTIFYPLEQLFTQVHFRYFKLIDTLNDNVGSDGLQCHRQRGKIPPSSPGRSPLQFEERRISIFGILSAPHRFNDFGSFLYKPSIYRVLILSEDDLRFPLCNLIDDSKLKWWPGLGAAVAFQTAIFLTVSVWEREWNKVLDQIEDSLSVELDETLEPKQISKWMFDLDFDRSRLYFTVLQVLRIFGECIRAVSADLSPFDRLFSPSTSSSYWDVSTDELLAYSSNWKSVTKHQKDTEERLLRRLLDKTEEVKSLRDGLFNASSLREARQSTTMNRYVIIFTVVTVLYLPPSFVSTVFGMTIFQKSVDQTTHEYKVTTVVVSLITYLVAIASVIAVDWVHIKRIILKWRDFVLKKSSVNGNSDPETVPENPAGPSHKSRPGDNEKKSGQSNAPQDVESAIDEEAGQATKSRFSWQKWLSKLPST